MSAPGVVLGESPESNRMPLRSLLTEQLRVMLEERNVRIGVISVMLVFASLFSLMPTPVGVDSGWMFIVPVAVSAVAAGLKEGLLVAVAASALSAAFTSVGTGQFDGAVLLSVMAARFALYGITSAFLGAFAEAHYSVQSDFRELASLDPLTKVANVASFYKELGKLEQNPIDFTILVLDVDELKSINDRYGHQIGSTAIQTVANILRRVVRGSDVLARYGGDEFVVILREADEAGARIVIQRIREMLENEILPGTLQHRVSVSIGWAIFGEDGKTSEDLLEAADTRMYRDKQVRKLARKWGTY
ncbi:MAG: GGDEF domain-containing protein [Actinomycetota bacterium]